MSAIDRLTVKLGMVDVAGHVRYSPRAREFVRVRPYDRNFIERLRQSVADTHPSDPDSAARSLARLYAREARTKDLSITSTMQALAGETGGEMTGVDKRLKAKTRIQAKIVGKLREEGLTPEQAAEVRISDSLRYTMIYDTESYTSGALHVLDRLEALGFTVKSKNYWAPGDVYNGVNVALTDPDGFPVEVQFHTPESKRVAEMNHPLYEEWRAIDETDRRYNHEDALRARELWFEMVRNASTIPVPPGVELIPGEMFYPYHDMPGLAVPAVVDGTPDRSVSA